MCLKTGIACTSYQEFFVIRKPVKRCSYDWFPVNFIPDYICVSHSLSLRIHMFFRQFFLITNIVYYVNLYN